MKVRNAKRHIKYQGKKMTKRDDIKELQVYIEERNKLFRNPSLEAAQAYWIRYEMPPWKKPDVPLAAVHKARLQWLDATDAMLAESIAWLEANGYKINHFDAPPLTPERRDADRVMLGKKPLNEN
jgi:hypothetical protein